MKEHSDKPVNSDSRIAALEKQVRRRLKQWTCSKPRPVRLPEGQALAHQDKTILQVTQIRKENLPYDMCQRVDLVLVG